MKTIVLASSSKYRQALLKRTGLFFASHAPDIAEDEISIRLLAEQKTPKEIAEHLAVEKAKVVAEKFPDALIIAGDQLVSHRGCILGKPESAMQAVQQLRQDKIDGHPALPQGMAHLD